MKPSLQPADADSARPIRSYADYLRYKDWRRPPVLHTLKMPGDVIVGRDGLIWV